MTRLLVPLAGLAFISLGLPDGLLGVAWPSIRAFFGVPLDALGTLLVASTAGYVASSFSSGRLLRLMNLGSVLALSCVLTALGLLGYATASHWPVMIALGLLLGTGAGAIDSALNAYAATHYGARTLNWLHACYGIGAAAGPVLMTAVLRRGLPWQRGYAIVGIAQVALAGCFALTIRWWPATGGTGARSTGGGVATLGATLTRPAARLGVAVFFVYSGVEASIGAWTYTLLTDGRAMSPVQAGSVVTVYWGSLTAGRLLAASAGGRIGVQRMLTVALWGLAAGTMLMWLNAGAVMTFAGIALAGCACGPVFPTLVATTPGRIGPEHAANAVGFQIASSALGLSLVPGLVGVVADRLGVETIATLLVVLAALVLIVYRRLDVVAPVGGTSTVTSG